MIDWKNCVESVELMASNSSAAMATASTAASVAYHVHHVPHHYQQEPYELSQDLIAKNLEVLEKKYGVQNVTFRR